LPQSLFLLKTLDTVGLDATTGTAKNRRQLTFNLPLFRLLVVVDDLNIRIKEENLMIETRKFKTSSMRYSTIKEI